MCKIEINPTIDVKVKYYAVLELVKGGKPIKTTKYQITKSAGYYSPMERLIGRDGRISMFLMGLRSNKGNAPECYLQAKDSLNFTGLKDYFINNKLSRYFYGYPYAEQTFSEDRKPNPFYNYRDDGFLFVAHEGKNTSTPEKIELLVITGGKSIIEMLHKSLMAGGSNDVLQEFREQAEKMNLL